MGIGGLDEFIRPACRLITAVSEKVAWSVKTLQFWRVIWPQMRYFWRRLFLRPINIKLEKCNDLPAVQQSQGTKAERAGSRRQRCHANRQGVTTQFPEHCAGIGRSGKGRETR